MIFHQWLDFFSVSYPLLACLARPAVFRAREAGTNLAVPVSVSRRQMRGRRRSSRLIYIQCVFPSGRSGMVELGETSPGLTPQQSEAKLRRPVCRNISGESGPLFPCKKTNFAGWTPLSRRSIIFPSEFHQTRVRRPGELSQIENGRPNRFVLQLKLLREMNLKSREMKNTYLTACL